MPVLQDIVTKGSTSRDVTVRILDSTGLPDTSIVFNTSGLDLWYRRQGGLRIAITEATLGAVNSAYSSGGFLHISDGEYRLDLPDAAYATGANYVDFGGTVTGKVVIGGRVRLIDANLDDSVRLGLTTLPNAAAEASGGLATLSAAQASNGTIQANVHRWLTGTPNVLQSGRVDTYLGAVATGVIAAGSFAANALDAVWSTADRQLTAFSTALALSVWHVLEASIVTASTIGLKVKMNLDAAITTRSSHAAADIWAVATRLLTAGTNIVLAKGTGVTGLNDLDATGIENATWNAVRASHTTAGSFGQGAASVQGNVTGSVASVTADVSITQAGADKVWGSATRTLTAFSTALALSVWDVLASAVVTASSIGLQLKTNVDAAISTRSTYAGADTAGTTTLLSRIVGTLLTGNHSPQSGDSFARLGATGSGLTSLASQTSVDDLPTNAELATALAAADDAVLAAIATVQADTDNLQTRLPAALSSGRMLAEAQVVSDKTGYALSTGGNNAVRDAVSDDIIETQGNYTVQQALSIILAAVAGRTDTGGLVFRTPNGTTVRITATVNGSNERTGITLAPSS